MNYNLIAQIGDVLVSPEIFTEYFCCDLEACKGECCVEGDAGAPVTIDEVVELEDAVDTVWADLSAQAQSVIDRQGVVYNDRDGELVTSIVGGKDCVFTCYAPVADIVGNPKAEGRCCLCAIEKAYRNGKSRFCKPISCALYPIREKRLSNGLIALNYNEWEVCKPAREKGRELRLPLWQFLRDPLIRRFGEEWYAGLEAFAQQTELYK